MQLSSRTVSLVAGNGVPGPLDGDLARTSFASPTDVAVAPDTGLVTILDMGNNSIREWDGMEANTFVHQGSGRVDAESGAQARFFNPQGLASDAAGNVYVADYDNHAVRKVTPEGKVTTLAGGGSVRDKGGAVDGPAASARFKYPIAVAADPAGNVYVADRWNHAIRRIAPDGTVSTVAGAKDAQGIPMKGFRDGPGADALFNEPTGVALDAQGNLFVADSQNHLIRKIDATGRVTTFAGIFGQTVSSGVDLATATFDTLRNLAIDSAGNLFVSQAGPQSIRKIAPGGAVSTLASNIDEPLGMVADTSGNLYVAAYNEGGILKFSPTGSLTRLSVPSSMEIRTGGSFPFGITLVGRRLVFSSGEHLATIDFAP